MFYDESSTVYLSNEPVPRLALGIDNDVTLGLEIGYRFHENFAASVTVGIPPEVSVRGNDALPVSSAALHMAHSLCRPTIISHLSVRAFEPYIGGGVAYMMIFDEQYGALSDLDVDNALVRFCSSGRELVKPTLGSCLQISRKFGLRQKPPEKSAICRLALM